jgi:hypothetical protein
LDNGI